MAQAIPLVTLNSGHAVPVIGLGTARGGDVDLVPVILDAIKLGYRHFDTASMYGTEQTLGQAIAEALKLGLIHSRDQLFITSKLWPPDAHPHLVIPSLKKTLQNLQLEYLDLYLIHFPLSSKPGPCVYPLNKEDLLPMNFKGVWESMEECKTLGLTRSIGVSNFSSKNIEEILADAKIPPAVNQIEMHPAWQQRNLREFCGEKGIHVTAHSPLGGPTDSTGRNYVMDSEVLQEIAKARGKTVAQVSLRWAYEQGASIAVKSFNRERMRENIEIFDWELSNEDRAKINQIPQHKKILLSSVFTPDIRWEDYNEFTNHDA